MRVALNLLGLPSVHQGGTGFYVAMLARGLVDAEAAEVVILSNPAVAAELRDLDGRAELIAVERGGSRVARAVELGLSVRNPLRYSDGYARPSAAFTSGSDLVHYPLSFMAGPRHSLPIVLTTLDLQHLAHPEFFSRLDRLLRRVRWHGAAREADRLITGSRDAERSLIERLGVDRERIDVIQLTCHPEFFLPAEPRERPAGHPYVLYPASPLPAKNHPRLIAAFARVAGDHPDLRLVLCGPALHDWSPVEAARREHGVEDRVQIRGHVGLSELRDLYAGALAMVFPSLYEGFGLPLVEAMAAGCPVAAADAASIPEIGGPEVRLFDPTSVEAISGAIRWAVKMPESERLEATAAGRRRAARFGPDEMVRRTVETYERVLA